MTDLGAYRSPLLELPGAVQAEAPDTGVAWHYGSWSAEQRRLVAGQGLVDLSHRGVVTVTGPDRLAWLHSLTTQQLEGLLPHVWTTTLVLSPQGHVEHALRGYDDGETFWAHVEPGASAAVVEWLDRMRFMLRVEVERAADLAVVATGDGHRFVARSALPGLVGALGVPSGTWAYEALRIAAGRPRLGLDTDHRTIPNEVGWIGSAVHLDKGCYRGQETVARVANLGRAPRRMVLLHLESGDTLPPTGSEVRTGPGDQTQRTVGRVGTVATHHELGPIALALVKRSVEPATPLLAGDVTASIDPDSVPPDNGEPPGRAALRRLRA